MRAERAATAMASPASGPSTSRAGATSCDRTSAAAAGLAGSRCGSAAVSARLSGAGSARLASLDSRAGRRRRWFLGETAPGGSSPSAARRISQSANKPSRFGPRAAAPTSTIKRPSAGVVAWITRRGAPPPPPLRRLRCRGDNGGGRAGRSRCRRRSRGDSRDRAAARRRGRGTGRTRTARRSARTAPRRACLRRSPCASPPCRPKRARSRVPASRRSPGARTLPPRWLRPPPTRDELLGEAAVLRPAHDNGPVAAVAQLLDERAPVSDRPALGRVSRAGSEGREPGVREPTLHQPLRHTLRRAATEVELRGTAIGARVELSRRLEVALRDRDAGAVGIELGGDEQGAGELALAVPRPAAADQQAQQGAAHAAVEVEPVRGGECRQAPGEVTDRLVGL